MSNTDNRCSSTEFIDNAFYPLESFSKICVDCNEDMFSPRFPKAQLNDVGVVMGALVALAKSQMHEFNEKLLLKCYVGKIEMVREVDNMDHGKIRFLCINE